MFTTNLQIHTVTCCIYLHIYRTLRIPYPFPSFSDFVVYVVTTLIFPKIQRQRDSFSINVAILFLSFKRAITVPNKLIDSQHYKRLRRKTLRTAFHSLSHFTLTFHPHNHAVKSIIFKNFKLLQNDSKTDAILSQPHLLHSNVTKT